MLVVKKKSTMKQEIESMYLKLQFIVLTLAPYLVPGKTKQSKSKKQEKNKNRQTNNNNNKTNHQQQKQPHRNPTNKQTKPNQTKPENKQTNKSTKLGSFLQHKFHCDFKESTHTFY